MAIFVQWTLPSTTQLPEDDVINTFTFDGEPFSETAAGAIVLSLIAFYNVTQGDQIDPVGTYLSRSISRTDPMRFKMWTITPGNLGEPDGEGEAEPLVAASGSYINMPQEVCSCLSFGSGPSTGVAARRRRGRVYIGPLTSKALNNSTGIFPPNISEQFRSDLCIAGVQSLSGIPGQPHAVWSRTGNTVTPVDRYWVDDEIDTQRRRGHRPTTRTQMSI